LLAHGRSSGALTLLRPRNRPLDADEVVRAEALAALLGPALEAQRRADQGALSRALDTASRIGGRLFGPGQLRIKIATALAAALLAFLGFASGTHDIPAAALLEGTVERQLVAPADGFITQALVRAGARVRAGDTLATLDDEAPRLEQRRWESQRDELTNEYNLALGALDRGAVRVLEAQIAQAEARLALAEGELERTRIVAPFDGLVVSGDLSQSLGSPVSRGDPLFRLAPLDGYRVILEVAESDVPTVRAGMVGRLVLAALPAEQFDVRVEWVNGMAKTADGRNVLEVEATLLGDSEHLRPGMRGAVRLDAGRARLLWIWTHRLLDRVRLWLWAWSPVV
jgi:multidrug efflux pump subunit AcrA (membrane-fusion protein)